MITPPKDKPVFKNDDVSAQEDELQNDEAVAAGDSEIKPSVESSSETIDAPNHDNDLNTDQSDVGLNEDQGEEFL